MLRWFAPSLLALALLTACTIDAGPGGKIVVVATTTQIGDMAANVGGDRIALTTLLKPNQDAHDFEPSPSQIRRLHEAAVVLRNGIGLDVYVKKFTADDPSKVVVVTEGIALRTAEGEVDGGEDAAASAEASGHDPHVWFSVPNAKAMVANIRDALAKADPANAGYYRDNAAAYAARLDALDAQMRSRIAGLKPACRKLVTNHDTLYYYAQTYGFTLVGSVIDSISSEARPSAKDFADVVKKIRAENVPAIFAEASINPSLIRQVGREAGVKVVDDLYGDSLGPKSSAGGTYIGMMQSDTEKIVSALETCE